MPQTSSGLPEFWRHVNDSQAVRAGARHARVSCYREYGVQIIRTIPLMDIGGSTINAIGETLSAAISVFMRKITIGKTR
jgi:hypothetical protein